jgi:hypothetical protein
MKGTYGQESKIEVYKTANSNPCYSRGRTQSDSGNWDISYYNESGLATLPWPILHCASTSSISNIGKLFVVSIPLSRTVNSSTESGCVRRLNHTFVCMQLPSANMQHSVLLCLQTIPPLLLQGKLYRFRMAWHHSFQAHHGKVNKYCGVQVPSQEIRRIAYLCNLDAISSYSTLRRTSDPQMRQMTVLYIYGNCRWQTDYWFSIIMKQVLLIDRLSKNSHARSYLLAHVLR